MALSQALTFAQRRRALFPFSTLLISDRVEYEAKKVLDFLRARIKLQQQICCSNIELELNPGGLDSLTKYHTKTQLFSVDKPKHLVSI